MRLLENSRRSSMGQTARSAWARTVLVHRPGAEPRRVTPKHRCGMLLPALPWAERARAEHDASPAHCGRRCSGAYLTELLQDALEYAPAREHAIETVTSDRRLGEELRGQLGELSWLRPEDWPGAHQGLARDEFPAGRGAVFGLLDAWDYVIDPLPNLVFARDICVVGDSVAVTSRPAAARRRSSPRSCSPTPNVRRTKRLYEPGHELLAGGDVCCSRRRGGDRHRRADITRSAWSGWPGGYSTPGSHIPCSPCSPIPRPASALDTLCTVAGPGHRVMRPDVAYSLVARTIIQRGEGGPGSPTRGRSSRPRRMPWGWAGCTSSGPGSGRPGPPPPGPSRSAATEPSGTTQGTCSPSGRGR